ncbi:PAS domain S-box protein [Salinimonas sp. HHU 13199]|uniref:histidine kinase n=2 Tax=Salinimonas profundi TaxID=2729140 RepID=A0ABR8LKB6_9ALTE|nr:PAS domain S-box protein [Salinimonas profundi]
MSPSTLSLIDNISDAVFLVDKFHNIIHHNHQAELVTGLAAPSIRQHTIYQAIDDFEGSVFEQRYLSVRNTGVSESFEAPFGPAFLWVWASVFLIEQNCVCIAFHESAVKRRLEAVANSQREALSAALAGARQSDVLNILTNAVEGQAGHGAKAAISLIDEENALIRCATSSGLPQSMVDELNDVALTVADHPLTECYLTRELIRIRDMQGKTKWPAFCQTAFESGLHAFWCTPLLSTQSKSVIGIFSVFYTEPRLPVESDRHVVDALSRSAAMVVERDRENKARLRAETALSANTETLNKQRRLYETALSNTPDLIYIFDLQGRFTYANDALLKMWGRTWDDSVGKTCLELGYEPWHAQMHMDEIKKVIETKQPIRSDVPFDGTQGRRIYDYIFVPVISDDGRVEAIAGSTRDVTERKEAEELAKKAEARRRLALEASHSFGIWDWDIQKNIFTADERLAELFNISGEEARYGVAIEKPLASIHPDDKERIKAAIEASIEHGTPYDEEYRIVQQNGSIRWASFRGRVIYDEMGNAARFPGVGVDVTRERNAIDALHDADKRKDEFLATLAHELRNPLAPIRNSLAILQSDKFDERQKEASFALVERQVTQMIQLVDDLMDVSRITRGKIRLARTPLKIRHVLDAATETIQPLIDECSHTLNVTYPEDDLWVNGDLIRLSQIFSNIINNAAKYTPEKGIINISVTSDADNLHVAISDNGAGIPKEKLKNVFDMFSQIEGMLERSKGGLGIGLTLVRRLTELHDGVVNVESGGAGKGTTFTVTLPLTDKQPARQPEKTPAFNKRVQQSSLNVLIADDNQDAAITMGWLLEAKGCTVEVVDSGEAALKAVASFTPDLVLLDIGMPGMNGYDLCIALQQNPALKQAIFVAQTGWGQPSHIQRSKASGFHHHLVKPINLDDLTPILLQVEEHKLSYPAPTHPN